MKPRLSRNHFPIQDTVKKDQAMTATCFHCGELIVYRTSGTTSCWLSTKWVKNPRTCPALENVPLVETTSNGVVLP